MTMKISRLFVTGATLVATVALAGGVVLANDEEEIKVKDLVFGEVAHVVLDSESQANEVYRFIPKASGKYVISVDDYDDGIDDVLVMIADPEKMEEEDYMDYICPEFGTELFMEVNLEKDKAYAIYAGKDGVLTAADYTFSINGFSGEGNPLSKGWWENEDGWLYNDEEGNPVISDWAKIGGRWYFFDNIGIMQTGWFYFGGHRYYLKSSGAMATGWLEIEGRWFYFDVSGVMAEGWKQISGKWYYFDPVEGMKSGEYFIDSNHKRYYFKPSGEMAKGWLEIAVGINSYWHYFFSDGSEAHGWNQIGGQWYFFDKNYGQMITGWLEDNDKLYYMKSSGAMMTGWFNEYEYWYYFQSSGAAATGWTQIGGKWYCFNKSSGKMETGWHTEVENGKLVQYYLKDSGEMVKGWYKIQGKWYYFESSGLMVTGTKKIGGKTYEFYDDGICKNP